MIDPKEFLEEIFKKVEQGPTEYKTLQSMAEFNDFWQTRKEYKIIYKYLNNIKKRYFKKYLINKQFNNLLIYKFISDTMNFYKNEIKTISQTLNNYSKDKYFTRIY